MRYATTFLLTLALLAPIASIAQTSPAQSYDEQLTAAITSSKSNDNSAEIEAAIKVISSGREHATAREISARIRDSFPQFDPNQRVRLPQEVISNLVPRGASLDRLLHTLGPLLGYCNLIGKVYIVLFNSQAPVLELTPDGNAIVVSTRALDTLNDQELEALAAHELCHALVLKTHRQSVDARDRHALRVIELFCDAGAAALVTALNHDPASLISGLEKLQQILEVEYSISDYKAVHPSIQTRARLNTEIMRQFNLIASNQH